MLSRFTLHFNFRCIPTDIRKLYLVTLLQAFHDVGGAAGPDKASDDDVADDVPLSEEEDDQDLEDNAFPREEEEEMDVVALPSSRLKRKAAPGAKKAAARKAAPAPKVAAFFWSGGSVKFLTMFMFVASVLPLAQDIGKKQKIYIYIYILHSVAVVFVPLTIDLPPGLVRADVSREKARSGHFVTWTNEAGTLFRRGKVSVWGQGFQNISCQCRLKGHKNCKRVGLTLNL